MSETYTFDLNKSSMYNLDTYSGRLLHFIKLSNPMKIFDSNTKIEQEKRKLDCYKRRVLNKENIHLTKKEYDELWDAKYYVDACYHPETGNLIPRAFRVYSFTGVNVPIILGLIILPTTRFNLFFFNTLNQSYNASLNYFIGSKSEGDNKVLATSFALAVSSSVAFAFLFKGLLGNTSGSVVKNIIQRIFPSCIAGFANLFFMRRSYLTDGIVYTNSEGEIMGKSKKVGTKAMLEGAISRLILPFPLVLSVLAANRLSKSGLKGSGLKIAEITLSTLFMSAGLPMSIALFNQNGKAKVSTIEPENIELLKKMNYKEQFVYYNKGL